MIKLARLKDDDDRFGFKKGDIAVVETKYDWDPEKVVGIGKLEITNDHSFYKNQLEFLTTDEVNELKRRGHEDIQTETLQGDDSVLRS